MKRYYKAMMAVTVVAAMSACTSVDDTLGRNYIPRDQQMELIFENLKGAKSPFETRLGVNDSVPASGQGAIFVGQTNDPVFGLMRATAMTDFYPSTVSFNEERFFGNKPVVDSIFADIMITDVVGDSSVPGQVFNIYRMNDSLRRDSTYKMHTPNLAAITNMSEPLFTFEINKDGVVPPIGALALMKLTPTEKGKAFMAELAATPNDVNKEPWPQFHKMFHGLYFAPAADYPANGAVYELELRNSYSGFYMWYHNYEEGYGSTSPDADKFIADTAYVTYDFTDTSSWYADGRKVNICVSNLQANYPFNTASDAIVTTGYVQTLGGVGMRLKASESLLTWIESLNKKAVFNSAELIVPVAGVSNSVAQLNKAPHRLGMYYWYGSGESIPDYYYYYELNNTSSFIPYGGYLQRSQKYYRMNITQWLTNLMVDPATVAAREIWLGPEIVTRANALRGVALDAAAMELKVAYTLTN